MPLIETEDRGAVRHIALNRPDQGNALNAALVAELGEAVADATEAKGIRAVVLRGNGPTFSSGMDPADIASLSSQAGDLRKLHAPVVEIWNRLEAMPKPTICQIHGGCIGRAMQLALACDLRVMAEEAVAGLPETRIGLLPAVGGCSRLPSVVGLARAKELVMTGRLVDGREAHEIGFANRTAPHDKLGEETQKLCDELLACAPLAVALSKQVMDAAAKPAMADTLEQEVTAQEFLAGSADFAEGSKALLEKRAPEFAGR